MKKLYFLLLMLMTVSMSFGQVFITEIADPNNNSNARFIELYNAGATAVDFTEGNGWQIDKYTNASATVSISLDLTGTIPAGGFYIIAYDNAAGTFATVYGFAPDQLDAVSNGVAGSNGDDDLVLIDGADAIVDFFGIPGGVDNTGSCAEYEDGRAERLTSVTTGNATFNEAEWNVWADSTVSGCTSHVNSPRTAPGDFDPGAWGTPTCGFSFSNANAVCDAITTGTDTYTATIDFSGGGTGTFTVTADSGTVDLTAGDPTNDATGTITITGLTEGVDVIINANDGTICDVDYTIFSPNCEPALVLPQYEDFTYADGPLINAPNWNNFSGTSGDLLVVSGQALVQHGTPSEDASIAFTPVSGDIYYAFDFSVNNPGSVITGGDYEYFAMFKDDSFAYGARLDIVEANTMGGDFTVGISPSTSTAEAIWATDLSFDTTYRATVRYNQDDNIAELWIDAASASDTSILFDSLDPGIGITQFALRQSDSSLNEGILVDNLVISQVFNETLSVSRQLDANNFSVYPNPTNTGFVNIASANSEVINVTVFDILGKQILESNVAANNQLNVSNLNAGVYILKLTQNNASTTKKLVIQ